MNVSAIIVTRGDVDLAPIIGQDWPDAVDEIVVWDNSKETDLSVYGRYAAIERAKNEIIIVQDDDVLLPRGSIEELIGGFVWEQATRLSFDVVVCNMPARFRDQPQYAEGDSALVGFGACFHRDAPKRAFDFSEAFFEEHKFEFWPHLDEDEIDRVWDRTCDIVFTALTPCVLVDVPYENLPWAEAENRMWKQPTHVEERMRMLELVRKVRDGG